MTPGHIARSTRGVAAVVGAAALLAGCGGGGASGGSGLEGTVRVDGSSTVAPLSEAAARAFAKEEPRVRVTVGTSGTGGGFEKLCAGEIEIADASREMKPEERELCEKNDVVFDRFHVANDGVAVVVHPDNDWVDCLTTEQLKKIWDRNSKVDSWQDVDPEFPDEELELYGPGTDSGTFDYFTEAINGEEGRSRTDYQPSEDDNITVEGVSGSEGGMGYFGLSYVEQHEGKVKALEIDGGDGCVAPTVETVQNGTYKPLSRPLLIYPTKKTLDDPAGSAFVEYYVQNTEQIAEQALFVPLTDEQQETLEADLEKLKR